MIKKLKQDFNLGIMDLGVLILSILCILFLSNLLYDDSWMAKLNVNDRNGDSVLMGFIDNPKNEVRRRLQRSLLWFNIAEKSDLFYGDSIYTGDGAGAVIQLEDGVSLELQPNSLVVLTRKDNELVLNLQVGQIVAKTQKVTNKNIQLVQRGQRAQLNLSKGEVQIAKSKKGTLSLAPIIGQVKIKIDNKENILNKNEKLSIKKDLVVEKQKIDVSLLMPARGEQIVQRDEGRVQFKWAADLNKADYVLEVAADRDFDIIVAKATSTDVKSASLNLIDGEKYFWRVKAMGKDILPSTSFVNSFDLVSNAPVDLLFPSNNYVQKFKGDSGKIEFFWSDLEFVSAYAIEIDRNRNFESPLIAYSVKRPRLSDIQLPSGEYFWRVRGYLGKTALRWSPSFQFKMESELESPKPIVAVAPTPPSLPVETPELPVDIAPDAALEKGSVEESKPLEKPKFSMAPKNLKSESEYMLKISDQGRRPSSKSQLANPPQLKWSEVADYPLYKVEFSNDESFKKPISVQYRKNNELSWSDALPGSYFWRVTALQAKKVPKGESLEWSKARKINLDAEAIQIQKSKVEKIVFNSFKEYKNPTHKVKLDLPKNPFGGPYLIKVDNGEPKVFKGSRVVASVKSEGTSEVQVALANKKGEKISPYSNPMKIKIDKKLIVAKPSLSFPAHDTEIVTFGNQGDDPVIFEWNPVRDANKYTLQISNKADFSSVVIEQSLNETNFVLDKELPKGKLYWRVKAMREKFESSWSQVWSFSL